MEIASVEITPPTGLVSTGRNFRLGGKIGHWRRRSRDKRWAGGNASAGGKACAASPATAGCSTRSTARSAASQLKTPVGLLQSGGVIVLTSTNNHKA